MLIVIHKRTLIVLSLFFILLFAAWAKKGRVISVFSPDIKAETIAVIDPGHGGEDGGAVSPDAVAESGINLAIAMQLRDLLGFLGERTIMTRIEDVSIGDGSLPTVRARKASDIRRRVEIVNETENAVLLSIHQNSLPSSPVTHGAQAFWNRQGRGEALAKWIQYELNAAINSDRPKDAREIQSGVYLMNHITAPGALVECGFLSNEEDTLRLQDATHQKIIAVAITAGYLRYLAGEEEP